MSVLEVQTGIELGGTLVEGSIVWAPLNPLPSESLLLKAIALFESIV